MCSSAFTVWWKHRDTIADPAAAPGLPRVCVIASTAAVGNAVRRNRAKRRLRETFRHHQHLVPPGCDLMLVARAAAQHLPITELAKKFSDACALIVPMMLFVGLLFGALWVTALVQGRNMDEHTRRVDAQWHAAQGSSSKESTLNDPSPIDPTERSTQDG